MGTCILCGEVVSPETGNAWKITPAAHLELGFERMHWAHGTCVERARAAATPPLRVVH